MRKKLICLLIALMINNFAIIPVANIIPAQREEVGISFICSINDESDILMKQQIQDLWRGHDVVSILNRIVFPIYGNILFDEAYTSNWYYHDQKQTYFKTDDNYGRLYIPDVGVDVSLIYIDYSNYRRAAEIVNAKDSAAFLSYDTSPVIADHNYQGFSEIKKCIIGTKAFIKQKDKLLVYECVGIDHGINDTRYVYDSAGLNIYSYSSDMLTLYTCASDWQHVYLVKFHKVGCLNEPQKLKQFLIITEWN